MMEKTKAQWAYILRTYGISKEKYNELNLGYCPICLRPWSDTVHAVVDHDHVARKVRGIVCRYCNHRIIGKHRRSDILRRVGEYLDNSPTDLIMPIKNKKRKKSSRRTS